MGSACARWPRRTSCRSPYVIYAGQVLQVPEGGPPVAESVERRDPPPIAILPDGRYEVRRGETLSSIARRLDMPMTRLAGLNDLPPPYRVYAGQKLRLPGNTIGRPAEKGVGGEGEASASGRQEASLGPGDGPPALSGDGFLWPTNGKVIGKFGDSDSGERRNGIDIAARKGAPVVAAENGVVVYASDGMRGYGRLLLIQHDQGYVTTYAHNAALLVAVGEVVARGQVVARVGDTGDVTSSQLHFELRKGSKPLDPEKHLTYGSTTVASR